MAAITNPRKWKRDADARRRQIGKPVFSLDMSTWKGTAKAATFTCRKHGPFDMTPNNYQQGHGCRECKRQRIAEISRADPAKWLRETNVKRRKAGLPTFAIVGPWRGVHTKTHFRCRTHGEFPLKPHNYQQGQGCSKCGRKRTTAASRANPTTWRRKANARRRDVGKPVYTFVGPWRGTQTETKWRCRKHGEFKRTPKAYLHGAGCPACWDERRGDVRSVEPSKWLRAVNSKRRSVGLPVFSLDMSTWKGTAKAATFTCRKHGPFDMTPSAYQVGQGCTPCGIKRRTDALRADPEAWLRSVSRERRKAGLPTFTFVGPWRGTQSETKWRCRKHGVFDMKPNNYQSGHGCTACAVTGFNPKKSGYVYLLLGEDGRANFGITNKFHGTFGRKRAHEYADRMRYDTARLRLLGNGRRAIEAERAILNECAVRGYKPILGSREEFFMLPSEARQIFDTVLGGVDRP